MKLNRYICGLPVGLFFQAEQNDAGKLIAEDDALVFKAKCENWEAYEH